MKSGRWSKLMRKSLRELQAEFEADPEPLNLLPELAQTRALYADYVRRCEFEPELWKPGEALALLSECTKIVKRIEDVSANNAVTRAELMRMLAEMGRAVDLVAEKLITDVNLRGDFLEQVREAWLTIRLA